MSRGHILVVDDEASILTTLQKTLSLEGYSVDVAGGFGVAKDKLTKLSYDLALFDVALPTATASPFWSTSERRAATCPC